MIGWSVTNALNLLYTEVELQNPRTHIENGRALFTDYQLNVQTNNPYFPLNQSSVRRRFSEFVWLREKLAASNCSAVMSLLPTLPDYKHFGKFKKEFILERMQGLQQFVDRIVEVRYFNKNPYFHLFLQTDIPVKVIEEHFQGYSKQFIKNIILRQHRQKVKEQTSQPSCPVRQARRQRESLCSLTSSGESWSSKDGLSLSSTDCNTTVTCCDQIDCSAAVNLEEYDIIASEATLEVYRAMSTMMYDRGSSSDSLDESSLSDHSILSFDIEATSC